MGEPPTIATSPTSSPTWSPTLSPSSTPTNLPTHAPAAVGLTTPTFSPTSSPATSPTGLPTHGPAAVGSTTPTFSPTFSPSSSPTGLPTHGPAAQPTGCLECTDEPSDWMAERSILCNTYADGWLRACNQNAAWIENKLCQYTCSKHGVGYGDAECCQVSTVAPATMSPTRKPTSNPTQRPRGPCDCPLGATGNFANRSDC